jgi:bifunctional DNA-binding transcriptional regulator/antitoxin component of YhaV-PrlF toxin-antitoxin module
MKSVITSKYQTTIPKKVREELKLAVNDTLKSALQGVGLPVADF